MMQFSNISAEWIDEQGKLRHEPRWLRQQRIQNWKAFQEAKDINWKKSKTPELTFDDIELSPSSEWQELETQKKAPQECAGKLTFFDGTRERLSLLPELAYQGVIFMDLQTAIVERADLIEKYFKNVPENQDKLTLLNAVLWQNGAFLYVPKGVKTDLPFQIQQRQKTSKNIFQQNIILLEEGSTVVVEDLSDADEGISEASLYCNTTLIAVDKNAHLQYFKTQNTHTSTQLLDETTIKADQNAKVVSLFSELGAAKGRITISGDAKAKEARIQHDAIIIGRDQQRFKIIAENIHSAQHTEGLMRYKGILKDEAYCDLAGLIQVNGNAQQTQSRLEEHTMIMSKKAKADALPALDIRTDDVQVSHAAAITQADEEKMFYLMSRGLSEDQAKALIVEGFFEDLLSQIPRTEWYEQTKTSIASKLLST